MIDGAEWQEAAAFLATPAAYGVTGPVELIETSISKVFLAGGRAYKIRKPLRLNYLDFSSLELRREDCEREVALNRRTAPQLYLGAIPVTREADASLALNGKGAAIEWAVVMRRFEPAAMLDRMASNGSLTLELTGKLARNIAAFHASLAPAYDAGGAKSARQTVLRNHGEHREFPEVFPAASADALRDAGLAALAAHAMLLDARSSAGWVRHCHGDLHLGNICCIDGAPTPFDCIEFNDSIARIDVLYDLAFLLMDLWRRGLKQHANHCLNQYMAHLSPAGADASAEGLGLLPLFLSCRAGVRSFVLALAARAQAENTTLVRDASGYFTLAQDLLRQAMPRLIAIGGLSGSGKSALARALAPEIGAAPGAIILRSDEIRKQLAGVPPLQRLPSAAYTRQSSAQVYACLLNRARAALIAGHSVIADAVFANAGQRKEIEAVARDLGIPFQGLWLDAPPEILTERAGARRGDASDADAAIVRQQLKYGTGHVNWVRIDASGTPDATLAGAQIHFVPR